MVTLDSLRDRDVVIYGTGINALKCVSFLEQNGIEIQYMLDGRDGIGRFKNYSVYKPVHEKLKNKFIVVASSYETYFTIKKNIGPMQEFKDFIYYLWIDKKMVFLHGNCHMDVIEGYLKSSDEFAKEFAIYPTPRICTKKKLNEKIIKYMDVWIHEDIRSNNVFGYEYSDEYVGKFIKKNAIRIVMPHLYNLGVGFFPHARETNDKNAPLLNGAYENGFFPHRDNIIDKCINESMPLEEIYSYVNEDNILPEEYTVNNFNIYIEKIKQREKAWDIKILDFILENYKKYKLFYDMGHPTNIVLKKISVEILAYLGIKDDNIHTDTKLDYHEVPIYPWIRKVLKMEWKEEFIRIDKDAIKCKDTMDIKEYIKEYVWWCYTGLDRINYEEYK